MTTFAALPDAQDIEALTCAAWMSYSDELRDLEGREYADAEADAWNRLQATLREIESTRGQPPVAS